MFNQFTKMSSITATEAIENGRRFATAAISLIPNDEAKDFVAKIANNQFTLATLWADGFDKMASTFKNSFAPATR